MRLASRFGYANQIRRDRPLTHEELMHYVPGIFGEEKHTSRSQNYTYIPTITVLESLQREGFQPFFACQTRVRDPGRRGYTKHMLRLRRAGEINGEHVPEIILLNSHDGTSIFPYTFLSGTIRPLPTSAPGSCNFCVQKKEPPQRYPYCISLSMICQELFIRI